MGAATCRWGPLCATYTWMKLGFPTRGKENEYVVAAVITNPDIHWHSIVNYYDDLARCWLDRDEFDTRLHGHFVFHALDVWHGSGVWKRERSLQQRMKIFKQLAQAPGLLNVPVCVGVINKKSLENDFADLDSGQRKQAFHGLAFNFTMQQVDMWMEENCPQQVCMVTAEDTDTIKKAINHAQFGFQTNGEGYSHENTIEFKSRAIVDTVNFADKRLSPIMQMADHCAFILRRSHTQCPHIGTYKAMIDNALYKGYDKKLRPARFYFNR